MPRRVHAVMLALAASGCSPTRFGWSSGAPTLDDYRATFTTAAGSSFVAELDRAALVDEVAPGRVLWLGDHHRSQRLHHLQRQLLLQLLAAGQRPLLALEAIGRQDEAAVADFLAGGIELHQLRAWLRRRWSGSWLDDDGLDAAHYRELLAIARQYALPVAALEPIPRPPLAERDRRIAARIGELAAAHADRPVCVVIGQAHLLGRGDLIARTGLPSLAIGGEPPPALLQAAARAATDGSAPADGRLLRSDGGLWWFGELLRPQ